MRIDDMKDMMMSLSGVAGVIEVLAEGDDLSDHRYQGGTDLQRRLTLCTAQLLHRHVSYL